MVRCLIKMSKYDKQQWWVCCSSYDSDCLFRFVCKILSIKSCRVFQLHCDLREEKLPDTFAPSADERDLRDARRAGAPRTWAFEKRLAAFESALNDKKRWFLSTIHHDSISSILFHKHVTKCDSSSNYLILFASRKPWVSWCVGNCWHASV